MLERMDAFFEARLKGYDEHMLTAIEGAAEFYPFTAALLPAAANASVLDLGCGTGLELDAILAVRPHLHVVGVDLCADMLSRLHQKHPQAETVCADYFTHDLGERCYDAVINFETLHHFTPEAKAGLYARIRRALRPGGVYLQAEYVACCDEEEQLLWEVLRRKRERDQVTGFVHFDAPLTLPHELALLTGAGFDPVDVPGCINGACFLRAQA